MTFYPIEVNGLAKPYSAPVVRDHAFVASTGNHSILRALYRTVRIAPAAKSPALLTMNEARRQAAHAKGLN